MYSRCLERSLIKFMKGSRWELLLSPAYGGRRGGRRGVEARMRVLQLHKCSTVEPLLKDICEIGTPLSLCYVPKMHTEVCQVGCAQVKQLGSGS